MCMESRSLFLPVQPFTGLIPVSMALFQRKRLMFGCTVQILDPIRNGKNILRRDILIGILQLKRFPNIAKYKCVRNSRWHQSEILSKSPN